MLRCSCDAAFAALPPLPLFEPVTATLRTGGAGDATLTYLATPIIISMIKLTGFRVIIGERLHLRYRVVVSGRRSGCTLLVTSGPFEDAATDDVVHLFVIGG